jgi:hypothetical protein
MLEDVLSAIQDSRHRDVALAVGAMGALAAGAKLPALVMFAAGARGLERSWREAHPEFSGGWRERWQMAALRYDETHQNRVNRLLHMAGIPMIVGGALGLLAFPALTPPWLAAGASFGAGWTLNILGHVAFEKNQPAFAEDPLSFLAGPIWDFNQLRAKLMPGRQAG